MASSGTHVPGVPLLVAMFFLLAITNVATTAGAAADVGAKASIVSTDVLDKSQSKIVKIHGSGGLRGLEAYQSGMLVSGEGHVLTVFSYVLDTDSPIVVLHDGRRFEAILLAADPRREIALLKIDAMELPYFDLAAAVDPPEGTRVLALSNLFDIAAGNEPVSVQQGVISVKTRLDARRGTFDTPYHGPVYVLDAVTNNPGAAGGGLVTLDGRLVGMLGKELQNATNRTWINYAVPAPELREPVERMIEGRSPEKEKSQTAKPAEPLTLADLGLTMVPEVLPRTPPYVDAVHPDSPAARAGIRPDDLITLVDGQLIQSCRVMHDQLGKIERNTAVRVTVTRGGKLVEFTLEAAKP
ncbi:MAG TPA: S1C family serine protease [Thermoguttaceae bacterium]|nr:S1C family serine protease [Thermoguttaceae bacterium]